MWALWYALAHPDRVKRLVLLGVPTLPKTRCPLPIRLVATPGLGQLLSRLTPPSPKEEFRALVSPFALLSPSVWGERDPVGSIPVARAVGFAPTR